MAFQRGYYTCQAGKPRAIQFFNLRIIVTRRVSEAGLLLPRSRVGLPNNYIEKLICRAGKLLDRFHKHNALQLSGI